MTGTITATKSKKYFQSYGNLNHVKGKPFVLAVTPFDRPFAYLQVHRAIDAVLYGYYVDEQSFLANPVAGGHPTAMHLQAVRKNDSVSIPLGRDLRRGCDDVAVAISHQEIAVGDLGGSSI